MIVAATLSEAASTNSTESLVVICSSTIFKSGKSSTTGAKTVSKNTSLYIMPEERSLDLDTEFDLKIMKKLISNEKK